jgi:hypothetical protein
MGESIQLQNALIGEADVKLGKIGGAPFYIGCAHYGVSKHTGLVIDVVPGRGGMLSLNNGASDGSSPARTCASRRRTESTGFDLHRRTVTQRNDDLDTAIGDGIRRCSYKHERKLSAPAFVAVANTSDRPDLPTAPELCEPKICVLSAAED